MNKFIRPSSWLLYTLSFVDFFLIGGLFVRFTEIADKQGFAGGATVVVYGTTVACTAVVAAILLIHNGSHKTTVYANILLTLMLVVTVGTMILLTNE